MGALAALLFCGAGMFAADLTGIWVGQVPTRNGEFTDIAFQFTQSGTKLSGKLYGDYRSSPIIEGIVAGDLVTFVVAALASRANRPVLLVTATGREAEDLTTALRTGDWLHVDPAAGRIRLLPRRPG